VKHVAEDLTALADGALSPEREAEVARHLAGCPGCRAERERIAGALAALARLPAPPDPSPDFGARLEARLARERRPGFAARLAAWRWRLAVPAAAAAALVSLAVVERGRAAQERELAAHLELLEDYVMVAGLGDVDTAEDAAIVAHLDDLVGPGRERKP
jgi:anti-sigma factor RsiW